MNKVFCRKRFLVSFILTGCLILFNSSCGLDTFYVIDPPTNVVHKPEYSSIDYSDSYFEFFTVDKEYDSIKFLGTEVYYKIYRSSSRLKSEAEDIQTISNRDDSTSVAAEKLIQTYRFQPLRAAGYADKAVLIPTSGSNAKVNIRLSDYNDLYLASITVDGDNIYESPSRVIPVRNLPNKTTFSFKDLKADQRPKSDDVDVNNSGSSTDSDWYVSMFAVAIGQDYTYASIYSNVLYLGSVRIPTE